MSGVLGTMAAFIVIIVVVGIGGFCLFTALGGGSDKPNAGQQTTNVHVNVQVAAPAVPLAPPVDHATLAAHAALAARAQAELYGPPAIYGQALPSSAAAYGQLPYVQQSPAIDQATADRALDAALQRRVQRAELER